MRILAVILSLILHSSLAFPSGKTEKKPHPDTLMNRSGKMMSLHEAVERGRLDLVQALLAAGADMYAKDNYGQAPIHLAAQKGQTALHKAMEKQHSDVVTYLSEVEKGQPDINTDENSVEDNELNVNMTDINSQPPAQAFFAETDERDEDKTDFYINYSERALSRAASLEELNERPQARELRRRSI